MYCSNASFLATTNETNLARVSLSLRVGKPRHVHGTRVKPPPRRRKIESSNAVIHLVAQRGREPVAWKDGPSSSEEAEEALFGDEERREKKETRHQS